MKRSRIVQIAVLTVLAAACARQPATVPHPDAMAIQTELSTRLGTFAKAIANKDAAGVANMFTEDGTWILPDASTFKGRASIEAGAKNFFATVGSFVTDEMGIDKLIVVNSSEAVTFSHGSYTITEQGKPAKRVNPAADYWKKGTDGVWRLNYDLNADGPATAKVAAKP
jgi:uncharacterized protein (TIGR02246 family)